MNPIDLSKPLDPDDFPDLNPSQREMLKKYNELTETPEGRVKLEAILARAREVRSQLPPEQPNRHARRAEIARRRHGRKK